MMRRPPNTDHAAHGERQLVEEMAYAQFPLHALADLVRESRREDLVIGCNGHVSLGHVGAAVRCVA